MPARVFAFIVAWQWLPLGTSAGPTAPVAVLQLSATPPPKAAPMLSATPAPAAAPMSIATAARSMQPGELVVLTITPVEGVVVTGLRAFGHQVRPFQVDAQTWRALIGIDLDVRPGVVTVAAEGRRGTEVVHASITLRIVAKRFPTRRLAVDNAYVNPAPALQTRIAAEATDLARLWTQSAGERQWRDGFVRPVPDEANSRFGTRSVFNGALRSPHAGADFLSPLGRPVAAPNAGRVLRARDLYFSGNTVIIDHGLGVFSFLAHLSTIDVQEGTVVTAGQVVGHVGATGRVTGPHLHWAVRVGDARVDPLSLLALVGAGRP